jgi:type III restriction enzyme
LRKLELIGEEDDWPAVRLANWLDIELHRGDSFLGLSKRESQAWLHRVVDHLTGQRRIELPVVVRRRHVLAQTLRTRIADHGREQARQAMRTLIKESPDAIEVSPRFAMLVEEHRYSPSQTFDRGHHFQRHAFTIVADMNREEAECATRIDSYPNVARWLRNTDSAPQGGFSLPKSPGNFFPDFIAELANGAIVLIEYKMAKMAKDPEELHKKAVGELWEARSNGSGRFAWILNRDWATLEAKLAR